MRIEAGSKNRIRVLNAPVLESLERLASEFERRLSSIDDQMNAGADDRDSHSALERYWKNVLRLAEGHSSAISDEDKAALDTTLQTLVDLEKLLLL